MAGDLVHDRPADLVGDLLLGAADNLLTARSGTYQERSEGQARRTLLRTLGGGSS
jgi:hypothetical protein